MAENRQLRNRAIQGELALERWLRSESVARYDAFKRNPRCRSAKQVFARLRELHAKRYKPSSQ
jgi:hypothetical protein